MRHLLLSLFHVVLCGLALAQDKPKDKAATPPLPPVLETAPLAYPFPLDIKAKVRDLQFEQNQLEIENQQMQVKIEQNKAKQAAIFDAIKMEAYNFAQAKKIDLDLYELDPKAIQFVKKKTK